MKKAFFVIAALLCISAHASVPDSLPVRNSFHAARYIVGAGNQPLFIINGKQITDSTILANLSRTLDTKLIEKIEVLKEATSTAVYGTAGAYGVILITTKQTDFTPKPFRKPPEYTNDNYTL